ncbi:hypothetical protein [Nocardioides sp. zg-DK7169]|uniref:hypothetical protein n=1 Tax=Nocardioides sp. zg-DK7169 TaxID=2736600 RepID=UPI0015579D7B|nr:hypothetical protein [Nocardioides sp. zg-DK7169]NPC96673.1 hypothetical protein [Nocardioides sp. zg-DK7169]
MTPFGLIMMLLVTAGVVAAILLFERSRAEGIRRDLAEDARRDRERHDRGEA